MPVHKARLVGESEKNFVWVHQTVGARAPLPAGSQRTRHLQRIVNLDRKRPSSNKHLSTASPSSENSSSQDLISESDSGAVVFLNTRQQDYSDSEFPQPAPIFMAFDSVCTPVTPVDNGMKNVIRYITTAWLPSAGSIPVGGLFGAFSPVWPDDESTADDFLMVALQSPSGLSLFSILTVAARRMARLTQSQLTGISRPDYYALRAVQSLREVLAARPMHDDQMILDLSFLLLAELYVKSPSEVKGLQLYWSMIRDCVVQCAGLTKIRPRILRFVLSIDGLFAGAMVTRPEMNILVHPELVGSQRSAEFSDNDYLVDQADHLIAQLDERSRAMFATLQRRDELISSIQNLPGNAIVSFRSMIRQNIRHVFATFATPLFPRCPNRQALKYSPSYPRADILYSRARANSANMWYWYAALENVPLDQRHLVKLPQVVKTAVTENVSLIDEVKQLLEGKDWLARTDMLLWMSTVGYLVAPSEQIRTEYQRLHLEAALALEIRTITDLLQSLEAYLPLTSLHVSYLLELWPAT